MSDTTKGLLASVLANLIFGVIYAFSKWLEPMSGTDVFVWRMIMAWLGLLGLVLITGNFPKIGEHLRAFKSDRKLFIGFIATAPMVIYQQWLFMWAPVNGYGLDAALGYFIFPLMMVLVGRMFFNERLNHFQLVAVILAIIGVSHEIWRTMAISWVTFTVFVGYAYYIGWRRALSIHPLIGLFFDITLALPISFAYLAFHNDVFLYVVHSRFSFLMLVGLGILTAVSMYFIMLASKLLSVTVTGLLSYLEPILLFIVAIVVLKENVDKDGLLTYVFIWAAVLVMIVNGVVNLIRERKRKEFAQETIAKARERKLAREAELQAEAQAREVGKDQGN